jgi:hypothetical protein
MLEGSRRGFIEVLPQNLPGKTEQIQYAISRGNPCSIPGTQTWDPPNATATLT